MPVDIERVSRILSEVAAEEILPRFQSLRDHEVQEKTSGELVTVADVAAERQLARRLCDLLPGSHVVGEEATAEDPTLLDKLAKEDDWIWVIDPIDGTGNFARGKPVFAVMAALVRRDEIAASWIHDPIEGDTTTAEHGAGAWHGDHRLRLPKSPGAGALCGTLHAGSFAPPDMVRRVQSRRESIGAIRSLRCSGREYLRLAAGETHYSLFTKLMPWDHAPGTLIYREAGGLVQTIDGGFYAPSRHRAPGLLVASDETVWRWVHDALFAEGLRAHSGAP